MANPWVTLLVTVVGGAFTIVLFPLARDYLKQLWLPDPPRPTDPAAGSASNESQHGPEGRAVNPATASAPSSSSTGPMSGPEVADVPAPIMALRRELIARYKWLGREMLEAQSLSPRALAVALGGLGRHEYRGDVLRWLANWMDRRPPNSERAAAARSRMLNAVRAAAAEYIERDVVLWRESGTAYQPGEVEGILDRLRRADPNTRTLRMLETWYEKA